MGSLLRSASWMICGQYGRRARPTTTPPVRVSRTEAKARSTSPASFTKVVVTRTPRARPAASISVTAARAASGIVSCVTRERPGTSAWRNCNRFAVISPTAAECPVMLPPGRASPAANPSPTGSPAKAMTMGMVRVACWAARMAVVGPATITSTLSCTSSVASSWSRSGRPSAYRASKRTLWPSTYPSERRPWRNASLWTASAIADVGER